MNINEKQKLLFLIMVMVILIVAFLLNFPPTKDALFGKALGGVCATNADCSAGEICDFDLHTNVCRTACSLSSDCGFGETCVSGACRYTENIQVCKTSSWVQGGNYELTQPITTNVDCMVINSDGVSLNCHGNAIVSNDGLGIGVEVLANNVVVKNCPIFGFSTGIQLGGGAFVSTHSLIGNEIRNSIQDGVYLAFTAFGLLRDNVIMNGNSVGAHGINVGGSDHQFFDNVVCANTVDYYCIDAFIPNGGNGNKFDVLVGDLNCGWPTSLDYTQCATGTAVESTDFPEAVYTFNSDPYDTSSIVMDMSGNGHLGTMVNMPLFDNGVNGLGIRFDGTNYLEVPDSLSGDDMSISLWVNSNNPQQDEVIISQWDEMNNLPSWALSFADDLGTLQLTTTARGDLNNVDRVVAGQPLNSGEWTHVTIVHSSLKQEIAIYLGNTLSASGPADSLILDTTSPINIGHSPSFNGGERFFSGSVDEVLIDSTDYDLNIVYQLHGIMINVTSGTEICTDSLDNDGDLFIDCADSDCSTNQVCINLCLTGNPNGVLQALEECDDNNLIANDGCSPLCKIDFGWTCSGQPSLCTLSQVCGDGVITGTEQCDDFNNDPLDGCDGSCQVETGFSCSGQPSLCTLSQVCGDGIITGIEQCDDNNLVEGDGCYLCSIETGYSCSGIPSSCTLGDVDGNNVLTIGDVINIMNHIIGQSILGGNNLFAADVNCDGQVNIFDILQIVEAIVSGPPILSC